VHRDIKCANILVSKEGVCKLADFGLATHVPPPSAIPSSISIPSSIAHFQSSSDSHQNLVGSPYWMAPEIITNEKDISIACDIWSLGCTIIEMLTGFPPHADLPAIEALFRVAEIESHPPFPSSISHDCESFLLGCFVKDFRQRSPATTLLSHPWLFHLKSDEGTTTSDQMPSSNVGASSRQQMSSAGSPPSSNPINNNNANFWPSRLNPFTTSRLTSSS